MIESGKEFTPVDLDDMLANDFSTRTAPAGRMNSFPPPGGDSNPLGFGIVARARRLEYKDKSRRRLMMGDKQSSLSRLVSPRLTQSERKSGSLESSPLMQKSKEADKEDDNGHGSVEIDKEHVEKETVCEALWDMFFGQWVSLLLVFAPFAIAAHFLQWDPKYIFWFCFLTMIPLASILGDFTEEAAAHTNEVIGGLVSHYFCRACVCFLYA